jgi:ketosteroid isomerase-like protein
LSGFLTPQKTDRKGHGEIQTAITSDRVRKIFKGLENGDGAAFFARVADDVDLTVMGTHRLAGHYRSQMAFKEGTFAKLGQVLPHGAQLHVEDLIGKVVQEGLIEAGDVVDVSAGYHLLD